MYSIKQILESKKYWQGRWFDNPKAELRALKKMLKNYFLTKVKNNCKIKL